MITLPKIKQSCFIWPPDINDPYVRKSTQYIYTVRSSENIGSGDANGSSDLQTSIRHLIKDLDAFHLLEMLQRIPYN